MRIGPPNAEYLGVLLPAGWRCQGASSIVKSDANLRRIAWDEPADERGTLPLQLDH
jgi:hypothetical protein